MLKMFSGITFRHNLSFAAIVAVVWILGDQNQSLAQKVSTAPMATLFSELDCKGQGIVTRTKLPKFSAQSFIEQEKSVLASGVWIFYQHENYNDGKDTGLVEYMYNKNQECVNFKNNPQKISSLRVVGGLENSSENVLSLFQGNFFQGKVQVIKTNVKAVKEITKVSSLIITGHKPWTVYSQDDYKGSSVCVKPPKSTNFTPGFVSKISRIWKYKNDSIKSVKIGCAPMTEQYDVDVEADKPNTHLGYSVQGIRK